MVAIIEENGRAEVHITDKEEMRLPLGSLCLSVFWHGVRPLIRGISAKTVLSGSGYACKISLGEREILIRLYRECDGYTAMRLYRTAERITVGSAIEDDICIRDENAARSQVTINTKKRIICDTGGQARLYRNGTRAETCAYETGDVFTFLNVRFLLMDHVIAVNTCKNVFTVLDEYESDGKKKFYPCLAQWRLKEYPVLPDLGRTYGIVFPKNESVPAPPAFDSIGPALTMALGSLSIGILMASEQYGSRSSLTMILFPLIMLFNTLFWFLIKRSKNTHKQKEADRNVIRELDMQTEHIRQEIQETSALYRRSVSMRFPFSSELMRRIRERPVFDCVSENDPDFLSLYLGEGERILPAEIQAEQGYGLDRDMIRRYEEFVQEVHKKKTMPLVLSLAQYRRMEIHDHSHNRCFTAYLILQLCVLYRPEDVNLVFVTDGSLPIQTMSLPHVMRSYGCSVYPPRELPAAIDVIHQDKTCRHVFLMFQPCEDAAFAEEDCVIVFGHRLHSFPVIVEADDSGGILYTEGKLKKTAFRCEACQSAELSEAFRVMAVHAGKQGHHGALSFFAVNGMDNAVPEQIMRIWKMNEDGNDLTAFIGMNDMHEVIPLNLHEKGDGPHGLVCGTTGSGKSEFLISFLLSLALHCPPSLVQIVIIDFKGTGLQQALSYHGQMIPHLAGVLSDLDVSDMKRALVSLQRECRRREKLFSQMHTLTHQEIGGIDAYRKFWQKDCGLDPLAHLVIVVDEFAELKKNQPAFMDELISIARVGRSLGIHMILSTQKPAGVVNAQIWSNTRFKVCLKVQDREDSREVLHDSCASSILSPGEFYLLSDHGLVHGCAGYSGAVYEPAEVQCILRKEDGTAVQSGHEEEKPVQRQAVSAALCQCHDYDSFVHPLWKPQLKSIRLKDIPGERGYLGAVDDYYRGCYVWYRMKQGLLAYSDDPVLTRDFIVSAAAGFIRDAAESDEIYVLAEKENAYRKLEDAANVIAVIRCDDDEALDQLNQRIRLSRGRIFLLIEDAGVFVTQREERTAVLEDWCRRMSRGTLAITLCFRRFKDLPRQCSGYFTNRIVVSARRDHDAADFFEKSCRRIMHTRGHALILSRDHILEMVYPLASAEEAVKQSPEWQAPYHFVRLPEHISLHSVNEIGMDMAEGNLVKLDENRPAVFTALYDTALLPYYRLYREAGVQCAFSYDGTWKDGCRYVFMPMDTLEKSRIRNDKDAYIIFIGAGFQKQYLLRAYLKRDLKPDEALLFDRGRPLRIRLADRRSDG